MFDLLKQPELDSQDAGERETILIVDDDEAMADVLSRRLRQQGFETVTADTGASGVAVAQSLEPALIVLDLRLPDTDGFTVCQRLVDSPVTCHIPVIILSGMERPDIIRRSRAAGCSFFVRKPYDPNALLVLIRQALDERKAWAEP
ncbi:MAG TPA: response regulator [Thermoguttaceae bacterium]|nr:response regulator [Thermoguttaceae bacterium]